MMVFDVEGVCYVGDVGVQVCFVVEKIWLVLESFGGRFEDVVCICVFVKLGVDWEVVVVVYGEVFCVIWLVNIFVFVEMIGDEFFVEIEVEVIVGVGVCLVEWCFWEMKDGVGLSDV